MNRTEAVRLMGKLTHCGFRTKMVLHDGEVRVHGKAGVGSPKLVRFASAQERQTVTERMFRHIRHMKGK